ncbi:MAG: proteinral secretion pathway protein D, partial [Halanaerobium sp.]
MIKIKKISFIILILVISLTAAASAGPQDKIEDMNFRNADIVDVLRAIAEVADVNLITDSQVVGNITVHLQDITFEKSLDLITKTRGLDYKWDNNTVVVAQP